MIGLFARYQIEMRQLEKYRTEKNKTAFIPWDKEIQGRYNMKRAEYCCKEMSDFIDDYRIRIDFDPDRNRHFIPLMWPHTGTQGLLFCPWCGVKLPKIIEKEEIS